MKPKDPAKLLTLQNRELNNGPLTTIRKAGFVGQDLVTRTGVSHADVADFYSDVATAAKGVQAIASLAGVSMLSVSGKKSTSQVATEFVTQLRGIISLSVFWDPAGLTKMKAHEQLMCMVARELVALTGVLDADGTNFCSDVAISAKDVQAIESLAGVSMLAVSGKKCSSQVATEFESPWFSQEEDS